MHGDDKTTIFQGPAANVFLSVGPESAVNYL